MSEDFYHNGLYYRIDEDNSKEVMVVKSKPEALFRKLVIPQYINITGQRYKVSSLQPFALYRCNIIEQIILSKNLRKIHPQAFVGCERLSQIEINPGNSYYRSIDGIVYDKDLKKLVYYPSAHPAPRYFIPESIETIGDYACGLNRNLRNLHIPDSVKFIGVESFVSCCNLLSISGGTGVEVIGRRAFLHCIQLHRLPIFPSLQKFDDDAFGYTAVSIVKIPARCQYVKASAFSRCPNLKKFDADTENEYYTTRDGVLYSRDMTILYNFPPAHNGTSYTIPDSVTKIGDYAFFAASRLSEIKISSKKLHSIGHKAFSYTGIHTLTLPAIDFVQSNMLLYTDISCITMQGETPPDAFGRDLLPTDILLRVPFSCKKKYENASGYWCDRKVEEYYPDEE